MDTPENHARLAEIRSEELSRALERLGAIESRKLGYVDSGMMGTPENEAAESFWQADFDEAVERLLTIVREVRPHVIVGYNDFGSYGHPDHIRAALIAKAAFEGAADMDEPPLKLYEVAGGRRWQREEVMARGEGAWRQELVGLGRGDATSSAPNARPTCSRWSTPRVRRPRRSTSATSSAAKYAAFGEHVTQLPRDGFFLALTEDDWRELFPVEEFTLRVSRIGVRIPEDDLFAGLR